MPHLFPYGNVVEVSQYGQITWPLQGESPPGLLFRFGRGTGGGNGTGRESGKFVLIGNNEIPRVGRVQYIFGELGSGFGERHVDYFETHFPSGIQIRSMAFKRIDGLLEVPGEAADE